MPRSTRRGDISELHQHWPNPEQALLRKKEAEKARADAEREVAIAVESDDFAEGEYAEYLASKDHEVEEPEEGFVTDDPAHNDPVGGVLGSRRMGRYAEEAKYPNRKWKRGDKHRGIEKPAKYQRRGGTPRSV